MTGRRRTRMRLLTMLLVFVLTVCSFEGMPVYASEPAVTEISPLDSGSGDMGDTGGGEENGDTDDTGEGGDVGEGDDTGEGGDTEEGGGAGEDVPPQPAYEITVVTETLGGDASVLTASVEAERLCEGEEARISVSYTGTHIWRAAVTCGEEKTDLEFTQTASEIVFQMPAADVEIVLSELEGQDMGDLSAADSSIEGDWKGNTSSTAKEHEPDVELGKSARWTDIEDGYAELTLTEKDTSDYTNIPVDYIIILDRTRTMSLSGTTWEQGGYPDIVNENSPCINPDHYYQKGGISLHLVDYFTGLDRTHGVWFDNLPGGASSWSGRHYNSQGQEIAVSYGNGCQDRLTMAKQAIYELVDQIAADNAGVPAGKIKSRVAFWSFADGMNSGGSDAYRQRGLYNYTPWTENYGAVKTEVSNVRTFAGTYYGESLKEVLSMINTRNSTDSAHAGVYTKVIFISDGMCGDNAAGSGYDLSAVKGLANQIKSLPNTELFTLAIGMPSDSEGARFLAELATQKPDGTYTANFWQNLSFSGGTGSSLAKTLFSINEKAGEIRAAEKVLTDQIETEYWEPVEVVRADGGTAAVTLDKTAGRLTWRIPEGAGKSWSCTVRLKLKDEYRYLLSDTSYPTNRDAAGVVSDPAKAGAVMTYMIKGGIYNQETRRTGVATPELKYGTVAFTGRKNWTVDGSRADSVIVRLMQTLPSQSAANQVNNAVTNASRAWSYSFTTRVMPDRSTKPLIKYDELGRTVRYEITEAVPAYYRQLESIVTEGKPDAQGGVQTDIQLYNEPFKVKAQLQKVDEDTGKPLSGAVFTVYTWSKSAGGYVPYTGMTDTAARPFETGSMTGAPEAMTLKETAKGLYLTPSWLYYSPDNQGKYRVVETSAPEGYYGDWKDDASVTEASEDDGKNTYEFVISPDVSQNQSVIAIGNREDGTFGDQRTRGAVVFTKNDREALDTEPQGDAALAGAQYGLYAAEDIVHQDGATGILYQKDQKLPLRLTASRDGVRIYRYDETGTDTLTVGAGFSFRIENLELGSYYLKEEAAGEGYLVDPSEYRFELDWQGEKLPVVELAQRQVCEQVKKQALSFYKVTGSDNQDQLDAMKGAGFSVYLVSELAEGRYTGLSDEELVQAVIDDFRDPAALDYGAFRSIRPAIVYEEADSEDVRSGRLVKSVTYPDGTTWRVSDYTENENAWFVAELKSDERGIVTTPGLPWGRYVVIETTTPENTTATRPFVIRVQGDDADLVTEGDGQGSPLEDLVILMDRPVMALVRILKTDSQSRKPVLKEGAAYVIRDLEGAWFAYYTAEMTTAQKQAYREQYGDLVVQYSQGAYLGTEEHPFTTKLVRSEEDKSANVYIETPQALPAGTYELREIAAPEGYVRQGHEGVIAKDRSLADGNQTFYETEEEGAWEAAPQGVTRFPVSSSEAVYDSAIGAYVVTARQKNEPAIGKISIYAEGEKLVSADREGWLDESRDYVFTYKKLPIEGAKFEIHAAEDICSPEGGENAELLYHAGELVAALTTDAKGQTWTGREDWEGTDIAKGLPLGTYTVTQVSAGEGFALSEENAAPRTIEIAYAGQEVPVIYRDTSYTNPRQQVRIAVEKQDRETGAALSGALFGLYAAEDILDYRGKTLVEAGILIATAGTTVDDRGHVSNAVFAPDLPLGKYYVKELGVPAGYASGNVRVNADASYRTDQRELISLKGTVKNAPILVQINLMDYDTEVELDGGRLTVFDEEGKEFTAFLSVHEDNPVIRGLEAGKTYTLKEMTSPEGYRCSLYLRGDYETSKEGQELAARYADKGGEVTDAVTFTVLDTEELQIVSVFNMPLPGELTVEKTGEEAVGTESTKDENGNPLVTPVYEIRGLPGAEYVLRAKTDITYPDGYSGTLFEAGDVVLDVYAGAEKDSSSLFTRYRLEIVDEIGELADVSAFLGVRHETDASAEETEAFYAEHGTDIERQIPSEEEIEANETRFGGTPVSFVLRTDEEGRVRISGLPLGEYEVIEVKAPTGYYRDKKACMQTVTLAAKAETAAAEVLFENAKQEIQTPPGKPEEPAPDDGDESTETVPVPAGMSVVKYSLDEGIRTPWPGAAFTLYALEDVRNLHGTVIYPAGQEIETAVSGKDGFAHFLTDVPTGVYRIRETKAPAGHYSSAKEIVFRVNKAEYNDNVHYLSFHDFVENAITAVHVKLVDDMTGNELAGAFLQVADPAGSPVEAWITKVSDGYIIKGLNPDTPYTITETAPRDGYLADFTGAHISSENGSLTGQDGARVSFVLADVETGVTESGKTDRTTIPDMTRILLENPFVTGEVRINKDGEVLESWSFLDKTGALISSLFHYGKEALEGAEFTVYAAEDIVHPDGVIGLIFRKGEPVAAGVRSDWSPAVAKTDRLGVAALEGLYLGSYEIVETASVEGYVRDTEARAFTLVYVDGHTDPVPAVEGSFAWTNPRQKLELKVQKTDQQTKNPLSGAVFGLYAAEDIRSIQGKLLVQGGTLLESSRTGDDGLALFTADLPVGYRYAVQEISAPEGYLKTDLKKEFTFTYAGEDTETVRISMTIENQLAPEQPAPSGDGRSPMAPEDVPTGDRTGVELYCILILTAGAAAAGLLYGRKRLLKK